MSFEFLDFLTMWLAFVYGAVLFFVLELPALRKLEKKLEQTDANYFLILRQHRPIALFCLWFGGLWILQDVLTMV